MIQAVDLILNESDAQAVIEGKKMWDEGYKAGVVEWKPKYLAGQVQIEGLQGDLATAQGQRDFWKGACFIGIPVAAALAIITFWLGAAYF